MQIIFIILAGIFKAVTDTISHHFFTSVFKKMDQRFWNPEVSYKYVGFLPLTKYRLDAWHLFNSLMISSFLSALCFDPVLHVHVLNHFLNSVLNLFVCGVSFNVSFNIFYNHILRSK